MKRIKQRHTCVHPMKRFELFSRKKSVVRHITRNDKKKKKKKVVGIKYIFS